MLKFFQEFLLLLNDYRTTLPARLSHVTAPVDSIVREHAALARRRHSDLANRAQRLLDRLRTASDGSARYRDAVQRAQRWMQTVNWHLASKLNGYPKFQLNRLRMTVLNSVPDPNIHKLNKIL